MEDPHHCKCYFVHNDDIEDFKDFLLDSEFEDELQEDHGQLYGYVLRVEDELQLHIKVMPDGNIESEMEPPPAYPAAHLNPEHSYSAHKETRQILQLSRVGYDVITPIPRTCIHRKIKKPNKPTHAAGFALMGILGIAGAVILKKLLEDDEHDDTTHGI